MFPISVLPPKTAVVEHYNLAFDSVTKTPATEMETVLAFPQRDISELLDLMPASTVVGMAAKSSKGLSFNRGAPSICSLL